MAGFALLMKAREDDRRLFTATDDAGNLQPPKLNVLSLQESKSLSADELAAHLSPFNVQRPIIAALVETFEHAKTFGSLIQIPDALKSCLVMLPQMLAKVRQSGDMYANAAADDLLPLVKQATVLAMKFDAVVANPPYMGSKYHVSILKTYLRQNYLNFDKDLFATFTKRSTLFGKSSAEIAIMSSNVWMFLSSYEEMRAWLLAEKSLNSLIQLSNSGFDGAVVFICAFTFSNSMVGENLASFIRLAKFNQPSDQGPKTIEAIENRNCGWFFNAKPSEFKAIPGQPITYWLSHGIRDAFKLNRSLGHLADLKQGMSTTDSDRFVRLWFEIDHKKFEHPESFDLANRISSAYWFPFNKGGTFKKWYGNNDHVVRYEDDGEKLLDLVRKKYPNISDPEFVIKNRKRYFIESVTYSAISSSKFGVRLMPKGFIFSIAGPVIQSEQLSNKVILAFLLKWYRPYPQL